MSLLAASTNVKDVYCEDAERFQEADGEINAIDRNARAKVALPKWRLKRVVEYVNINIAERISLANMAGAAGLSRMHFAAQFRIATGMRPHDFLLRCRIETAQELLSQTDQRVIDIALAVGFQTQAHFTTVFRRLTGDTPRHWRVAKARQSIVVKPRYRSRADISERASIGLVALGWEGRVPAMRPRFGVGI
ncbi:MAG TPA: AraC family transcriptional regulator [Ancylobacter sp.]